MLEEGERGLHFEISDLNGCLTSNMSICKATADAKF